MEPRPRLAAREPVRAHAPVARCPAGRCGLGAFVGLMIASVAVSAVKVYAPADIPRLQEITLSLPAALFSAAVLVVVTLIVGLAPIAATRSRGIGGVPTS